MDREVEVRSYVYQLLLALAHLLSSPALHGVLIDRQRLVGHHQVLADAHHLAESLAFRACPVWVVEVEHQVVGLPEVDAVGREALREGMLMHAVGAPHHHDTLVVPLEIGCLHGVGEARHLVFVGRHGEAVDQKAVAARLRLLLGGEHVGDVDERAVLLQTGVALLEVDFELLTQ